MTWHPYCEFIYTHSHKSFCCIYFSVCLILIKSWFWVKYFLLFGLADNNGGHNTAATFGTDNHGGHNSVSTYHHQSSHRTPNKSFALSAFIPFILAPRRGTNSTKYVRSVSPNHKRLPCRDIMGCDVTEGRDKIPAFRRTMLPSSLGILPHHYTASQPRRPRLEYSPPWKSQVSYHYEI